MKSLFYLQLSSSNWRNTPHHYTTTTILYCGVQYNFLLNKPFWSCTPKYFSLGHCGAIIHIWRLLFFSLDLNTEWG